MHLMPCPFCGGSATVDRDDDGRDSIACTICYATTWQPLGTQETLVETWNSRVSKADERVARMRIFIATIKQAVEARGLQDDDDMIGRIYRDACRELQQ
jgi:Restriction alleviation protein Lar